MCVLHCSVFTTASDAITDIATHYVDISSSASHAFHLAVIYILPDITTSISMRIRMHGAFNMSKV